MSDWFGILLMILSIFIGGFALGYKCGKEIGWEDERKKIADALSEKMAYMNTCLNTRDTILGYLGVERPVEPHCNSDCWNEKCESYHYATKKLPSTSQERKKGKWINHRNDMGHNIADCSECGETMQWYDPDTRPNYCPNCGADMRENKKIATEQ